MGMEEVLVAVISSGFFALFLYRRELCNKVTQAATGTVSTLSRKIRLLCGWRMNVVVEIRGRRARTRGYLGRNELFLFFLF